MKASIRYIHSPDVQWQEALLSSRVRDGLSIQVIAGPDDGPGEESFDLIVCTPDWLTTEIDESGPQFGRHLLIVSEMNPAAIDRALRVKFESETGTDWDDLALKLGRWGHWEFEDHDNSYPSEGGAVARPSE